MSVTMETGFEVLSNGELESIEDLGNGFTRTTWVNNDPISTYLISVAAYIYDIIDADPAGVNDTPIAYWVYPHRVQAALYDFERTGEMLELFEEKFGPYPFNKYDQAMAPIFYGWGAMEHQTCTSMLYRQPLFRHRYDRYISRVDSLSFHDQASANPFFCQKS